MTQYSMKTIEKIGLVKFDLLGLKTLTIIDNVIKMLKAEGTELDITAIPLDDQKTYRLLASGNTSGIFQLESRGMRELLTRLKPSQFEDIIALIALYRPGPLGSGMIDDFIKRKHNPGLVRYETELLREALEETYGVIVYQEQIMKIASLLANFTKSEADQLRKAISKKIPEQLESYKEQFKEGCAANNVRPEVAAKIYEIILRFGQYGFNKSHSAAYALVAYQTAYLKAHHYLPFMAAILTNEVNDTDGLIRYITECRENGVVILPPDINESAKAFTIVGNEIRYGLLGIKGVGEAALDSILGARQECSGFSSFTHFCSLVDSRKVNKKVVECLIKAGAFDCTGLKRSQLFTLVQEKWDRLAKKNSKNGLQMDIFGSNAFAPREDDIPQTDELDHGEILKGEKEALGFFFSQHPLSAYGRIISRVTSLDTGSIKETETTEDVTIVGIVNGCKEITTKRGDRMANISLEDTKGIIEVIVFPDQYSKNLLLIRSERPLVVTGALERTEDGTSRIRAKNITPLEEIQKELEKVVRVKIDCGLFKKDYLRKLRDVLVAIKGDSRVMLEFLQDGEHKVFDVPGVRIDAGKTELVRRAFAAGLDIEVRE